MRFKVANYSRLEIRLDTLHIYTHLPFLTEWYDDTYLKMMPSNHLANQSIQSILPSLRISQSSYNQLISISKTKRYQMVDLINKTKNDVVAFDSLEDYVYNAMLQEQSNHRSFNLFSLKDWIFLLTSLVAIVALGLSILLYCKIRTILILLGTMHGQTRAERLFIFTSSTAVPETDNVEKHITWLRRIVPCEIIIVLCLFAVIVLLTVQICMFIRRKRINYATTLKLAVTSNTGRVTLLLNKLAYPAAHYKLTVQTQALTLQLIKNLFSYSINGLNGFTLQNIALNLPVAVNYRPTITIYTARRLQSILKVRHVMTLEFYDVGDNLVETVLVTPPKSVSNNLILFKQLIACVFPYITLSIDVSY